MSELKNKILTGEGSINKEKFDLGNGVEVELRMPCIGEHMNMMAEMRKQSSEDESDFMRTYAILQTIYNTYDPETGERVFSVEDFDTIAQEPVNSPMHELVQHMLTRTSMQTEEEGNPESKG